MINFDYPQSSEDYIHRIGRTGRSDTTGTSYALFTDNNMKQAKDLVAVLREANQVIAFFFFLEIIFFLIFWLFLFVYRKLIQNYWHWPIELVVSVVVIVVMVVVVAVTDTIQAHLNEVQLVVLEVDPMAVVMAAVVVVVVVIAVQME